MTPKPEIQPWIVSAVNEIQDRIEYTFTSGAGKSMRAIIAAHAPKRDAKPEIQIDKPEVLPWMLDAASLIKIRHITVFENDELLNDIVAIIAAHAPKQVEAPPTVTIKLQTKDGVGSTFLTTKDAYLNDDGSYTVTSDDYFPSPIEPSVPVSVLQKLDRYQWGQWIDADDLDKLIHQAKQVKK
jgi:hypothetical protein